MFDHRCPLWWLGLLRGHFQIKYEIYGVTTAVFSLSDTHGVIHEMYQKCFDILISARIALSFITLAKKEELCNTRWKKYFGAASGQFLVLGFMKSVALSPK